MPVIRGITMARWRGIYTTAYPLTGPRLTQWTFLSRCICGAQIVTEVRWTVSPSTPLRRCSILVGWWLGIPSRAPVRRSEWSVIRRGWVGYWSWYWCPMLIHRAGLACRHGVAGGEPPASPLRREGERGWLIKRSWSASRWPWRMPRRHRIRRWTGRDTGSQRKPDGGL
jgi:hypothetical protein